MLFSVIIVAHNEERYIEDCLNSVINQRKDDLEIVIVDDHSTDNTLRILEEYSQSHENLHVLVNSKNIGAGESRNRGIRSSHGKYLLFLDADDYLSLDAFTSIETLVKVNPLDMVVFNHSLLYDSGKLLTAKQIDIFDRARSLVGQELKLEVLALYQIACNKAYRRDFLLGHSLVFSQGNYEDTAFAYKSILLAESIGLIPLPLYIYRQRPGTSPYRPNRKNKRVNQSFLVKRYEEVFEFLLDNNMEMFGQVIYTKMITQFTAVVSERLDKSELELALKMTDIVLKHQTKYRNLISTKNKIAYWCFATKNYKLLIALNAVYSYMRRIIN